LERLKTDLEDNPANDLNYDTSDDESNHENDINYDSDIASIYFIIDLDAI
jgi:hypothetical protein